MSTFSHLFSKILPGSLACLFLLFAPQNVRGAVILVIDLSDLQNVAFSATSAFAQNNDGDTFLQEGFTLIDFFTSAPNSSPLFFDASTLRSPGGNFAYTEMVDTDYTGGIEYNDLNIFGSGFSFQDFSISSPALTGSAAADLTVWLAYLPAAGAIGNIYSGDRSSTEGATIIGQYMVVPEPAILPFLLAGGLLALRRTRRS